MEKINIYEQWKPIDGLPEVLYVEGLHDDYEGVRILLKGEQEDGKMLVIKFDPALSYRNTDEGDRHILAREHPEVRGTWSLFKAEQSEFIDWFNRENQNIRNDLNIVHYLIVTESDVIDILAGFPPKVEWLD